MLCFVPSCQVLYLGCFEIGPTYPILVLLCIILTLSLISLHNDVVTGRPPTLLMSGGSCELDQREMYPYDSIEEVHVCVTESATPVNLNLLYK